MQSANAANDRLTLLYEQHYWAVLRFAVRRLRDAEAARDVAAETFAVAWRRIEEVPAFPLPWLYGIARHLVANEVRRALRADRLVSRLADEPPAPHRPAGHPGVSTALARLSEHDQEVLRLSAWEELTAAEIAHALRCSKATAAVRLHRARRRLRAVLTGEHSPDEDSPTSSANVSRSLS